MNYELHSAYTKFGVNKKLIANYFLICLLKEGFNNQQTPIRLYVNKKRKLVLCKLRSVVTKIGVNKKPIANYHYFGKNLRQYGIYSICIFLFPIHYYYTTIIYYLFFASSKIVS